MIRMPPSTHGSVGAVLAPSRKRGRARTVAGVCTTLWLVVAGCGGSNDGVAGGDPAVRFDTISGVVHVFNEGGGLWSTDERWSVHRTAQVGSLTASEDETFASVAISTLPGPDGHLFVLDYVASRVLVFTRDGRFVRQVGRRGEGPGEFRAPTGLAIDSRGTIWVADAFGPAYKAFTPSGELLATLRSPVHVTLARQQQLVVRPDGRILDVGVRGTGGGQQLVFTMTDPGDESADTVWSLVMPERGPAASGPVTLGSAFGQVVSGYLESMVWTPGVRGSLWFSGTGGAELVNLSAQGDTLRVVHVAHRPRALTDAEERLVGRAIRERGISEGDLRVVPRAVQFMRVMHDGHLLVFVNDEPSAASSTMEVYDPEGRYLGALELGFGIPRLGVAGLRGDTLVAPMAGPLDATFVVRATIERP